MTQRHPAATPARGRPAHPLRGRKGAPHASAEHHSPYGIIGSSWRHTAGVFALTVTVPPGTTAAVELPDGSRLRAGPGRHGYEVLLPTARGTVW